MLLWRNGDLAAIGLCPEVLWCTTTESGLDFISSNVEARKALMHLHPCKLMRPEQGQEASPAPAAEPALRSDSPAPSTMSGSITSMTPDTAASQQKQLGRLGRCISQKPAADPSAYEHIKQEQVSFTLLADTWHMPTSE